MERVHINFFFAILTIIAAVSAFAGTAYAAPVIRNVYFDDSLFVNTENRVLVNITDSEANISTVLFSVTSPESNNFNMQKIPSGYYEYVFTPAMIGTYTFYIWGINANGQSITSSTYNFLSLDDRPVIEDIIDMPDPVVVSSQSISFYADISDPDNNLDTAWVQIRSPESEKQNITLTNISNTFVGSFVPNEIGTYKYAVWASDDAGNVVYTQKCSISSCYIKEYEFVSQNPTPIIRNLAVDNDYFYVRLPLSMPEPTVKISANITNPYGTIQSVNLTIYYPDGTVAISQILTSATDIYEYTYAPQEDGEYRYVFYARDVSGTISSAQNTFNAVVSRPRITNVMVNPEHIIVPAGGVVRIEATVTDPHNDTDKVFLHISAPDYADYQMTNIGNNIYQLNLTVATQGIHYYYIWANDSRNNLGRTRSSIFGDERDTDELNVSVEAVPKCCAKFDYITIEADTNYTHFETYSPFIDYSALGLRKTKSLLSNCGNLDINITNNCLTLRKEEIQPGQENITITGDNTTYVVAYCCWNEEHMSTAHGIPYGFGAYAPGFGAFGGPTYFCEWNKEVIPMPPFELNTFEDFFMYFSYEVLYEGWYNITASAYYERYNQSDCDIHGYGTDRCQCEDTARMVIRFLKEVKQGVTPHLIPQPIPVPVSDMFVPKPDIAIIREMPQYIDQINGTCDPDDPWNTCTFTKIKLILFNRGTAPAYNVTLNDTAIVSNEEYRNFCPLGPDECNPTGYVCVNNSGYTCMTYNDSQKVSAVYLELDEELEPREYMIVEYLFAPNENYRAYNISKRIYYDFDARAEYIYQTQVNNYDVFIQINSSEDSPVYNPDESDWLYLDNRPGFYYDLDTNIHSVEETRNIPVDTYTIFNMDMNAIVGEEEIENPWEATVRLDESWTIGGCAQDLASEYECEYSNTEHWVKFMKEDGRLDDKDSIRVQFMAKTSRIADFVLETVSSDDANMDEDYMPGIFVISNPVETVSEREPSLVIIREMVPEIFQKEGCNETDPTDNCTYAKVRLLVYNRGAETAFNVRLQDVFDLGSCDQNNESMCYPFDVRCPEGMLAYAPPLNITNITIGNTTILNITYPDYTETRPYTCSAQPDMSNGSMVNFNITYKIYPFDYRVVEYEIVPPANLSAYSGSNYYRFESTVNYMNENNRTMPTAFENDAKYNPPGSKYMYLDNRTVFEYDIDIDKTSVNDTLDRDFPYGVYSLFSLKMTAKTGDAKVELPWLAEFPLPYSWDVASCESQSSKAVCIANNTLRWIKVNGTEDILDGDEIEIIINASAREMKDFFLTAYSSDNRTPKSMDENYIPGLWTISRLTHFVDKIVLEPYPSPVPEPQPQPRPMPIPEPVPEPDNENKLVLTIEPLNWTLQTYQGEGVTVSFEIENLGNSTINDIIIDAIHFEGWEYESALISEIAPGEKLERTIFLTPAKDALPGYYIIAVSGYIEDGDDETVLDITYFQLLVVEGKVPAKMDIVEFSDIIELDPDIEAYIPVLVKNTGSIGLHNVTVELENMEDCIAEFEPFREYIEVNETKTMYFKIRTKDTGEKCKGSMILKSDEGAYAFSKFEITIKAQAALIPQNYTTLIILALYAAIMTIYALYRRKHAKDEGEEEDNEPLSMEEKKKKIIRYLAIILGGAAVIFAAYYGITLI